MRVETVIDILKEIKEKNQSLTNAEILKVLEIKTMMEANSHGR